MISESQTKTRAMVAMSGGVDSAVAASLMKQKGYDITGVTMKLFCAGDPDPHQENFRLTDDTDDIRDAKSVAEVLHIPHQVAHLEATFCRDVIRPFVDSYIAGTTPNPCVTCNKKIKFGALLSWASDHGMNIAATGHYAKIEKDTNGQFWIKRAKDTTKDQTYMLWTLTQDILSRICFPLGDMTKAEVRELAETLGFKNAGKHDSQDICFLPDGDYASFLKSYAHIEAIPGNYTDIKGNVIGKHKGIIHYTIGQRKGLGVAFGEPMYVFAKNAENNTVTLATDEELYAKKLTAIRANWMVGNSPTTPVKVQAKIRYQHQAADAYIQFVDKETVAVEFLESQRAIAPGQSVVFYDGDVLLGGGIIC